MGIVREYGQYPRFGRVNSPNQNPLVRLADDPLRYSTLRIQRTSQI